MERKAKIEADQIIGDLRARRTKASRDRLSLLDVAFAHLKAYEARRARSAPNA